MDIKDAAKLVADSGAAKAFSDAVDRVCFGDDFERLVNWRLYPLPNPSASPRHAKG